MRETRRRGIGFAILAAALYAFSTPFSKLLLRYLTPTGMAALLYLGAGTGMLLLRLTAGFMKRCRLRTGSAPEQLQTAAQPLCRADLPYIIGMILLDIAAPILLMTGLSRASAANVSLLNNFEIVATSLIAFFFFREKISGRLWTGIVFVTLASMLLSFESAESLHFSMGSLFVLLACSCWGLENNCTRALSAKDPVQIVIIKGLFCGTGSLLISMVSYLRRGIVVLTYLPDGPQLSLWGAILCAPDAGTLQNILLIAAALLLGFVAYGLSIYYYIRAQRILGAAGTSAYYAFAPFIAAGISLVLFRTQPGLPFAAALLLMLLGAYFCKE